MEGAEEAARKWMSDNKFWPNVWYMSDHGNYSRHALPESAAENS